MIFHKELMKSIESHFWYLIKLAPSSREIFNMIEYLNNNIIKIENLIDHLYTILNVNGAMLVRDYDDFYVKKCSFKRLEGKLTRYQIFICFKYISEINSKSVNIQPALRDVCPKNNGLMFIEELFWNINKNLEI